MSDARPHPDLDRLRAYADGTLDGPARAEFEERLAREPDLAGLLDAWHVAGEADPAPADGPRTRFGDLKLVDEVPLPAPRARGRLRALRRIAVAALLLLAAGIGWRVLGTSSRTSSRTPPGPPTVRLASVPLDPGPAPANRPEWPRALLTDRVLDGQGRVVWRDDLDSAARVARALGRPLLLFVEHETCPYCREYDRSVFRDRVVTRAVEPFVLVRLMWNETPPDLMRDPSRGWPLFHLLDTDRERLGGFTGFHAPEAFVERLEELRVVAGESGRFAFRDRERVRALARRLAQADDAATAGERWGHWRAVAEADPRGHLGDVARARLDALRREAAVALRDARDATPDEARARLDAAVARLAGTPPAEDLARVRDALAEHGAFPRLEESPR